MLSMVECLNTNLWRTGNSCELRIHLWSSLSAEVGCRDLVFIQDATGSQGES